VSMFLRSSWSVTFPVLVQSSLLLCHVATQFFFFITAEDTVGSEGCVCRVFSEKERIQICKSLRNLTRCFAWV